jgi:hypothetical protein
MARLDLGSSEQAAGLCKLEAWAAATLRELEAKPTAKLDLVVFGWVAVRLLRTDGAGGAELGWLGAGGGGDKTGLEQPRAGDDKTEHERL